MIRGNLFFFEYSEAVRIASPTAIPIEPPINLKSNITHTTLFSSKEPEATIIASCLLFFFREFLSLSEYFCLSLNFNGSDVCALEFDDNAIVINSFSKYFSLTGWRLGWVIVPSSFTRTLEKLAQNLFICPSHASQLLGLFVLNSSVNFDDKVEQYKSNRDLLMRTLPKIGFKDILEPDGAFYLYADVSAFKKDSLVLVKQILRQTGVAITPGYDFDTMRGHKTVRFSFACSHADVEEALNRLTDWYQTYPVSSV